MTGTSDSDKKPPPKLSVLNFQTYLCFALYAPLRDIIKFLAKTLRIKKKTEGAGSFSRNCHFDEGLKKRLRERGVFPETVISTNAVRRNLIIENWELRIVKISRSARNDRENFKNLFNPLRSLREKKKGFSQSTLSTLRIKKKTEGAGSFSRNCHFDERSEEKSYH